MALASTNAERSDSLGSTDSTGSHSLCGRIVSGRYRIRELIGRGGQGRVYAADHTTLGFPVAVKVLRQSDDLEEHHVRRFEREALLAARLRHRNIAAVFDFGRLEDDGSPYLVMEHIQGPDLATIIGNGTLDAAACVDVGVQLLAALTALHEQGIVHRDIKPQNLMLQRAVDGAVEIKLIDFGISRTIHSEAAFKTLTARDSVLGTPHYMAPEQVRGAPVDIRTDLYATGVLLYEGLTGLTPFDAPTPAAVLARIITTSPAPIREHRPDLPAALAEIIDRAIQPEPDARFAEPSEMARALRRCANELGLARGADAWAGCTQRNATAFGTSPVGLVSASDLAAPLGVTLDAPAAGDDRDVADAKVASAALPLSMSWRRRRWIGLAMASALALASIAFFSWADATQAASPPSAVIRTERVNPDDPIALTTGDAARVVVSAPVDVAGIESRARAAFLDGREVEAMHLYGRAAELAPLRASAWRGLGLSAMAAGARDTAAPALRRYLELAPEARDRAMIVERLDSLESGRSLPSEDER